MRTVFAIFAIFAIVAVTGFSQSEISDFKEEAPVAKSPDMELLSSEAANEASATIKQMKKKGASEQDCKNLAELSCKEVIKVRKTNQIVINRLSDGRRCNSVGNKAVHIATLHWRRTHRIWLQKRNRVYTAYHARVHFKNYRSFASLRSGKCGFIFRGRNYIKARNTWYRAKKVHVMWHGKASEARKAMIRVRKIRISQQRRCHCAAQRAERRVWASLTRRSLVLKENKAYAKCQMMACVLKGISLKSAQCRKRLPALRKKKLNSVTIRTRNC